MAADIEQQLRRTAKRCGLSMLALSKRSGVPYSAVHGYMTGDRRISLRNAAKLAKVLGLELKPKGR